MRGLQGTMTKLVIFTDLDGSLLHPKSYSFEDAAPALELIRERGIPLVLCSSKTRAELEVYRQRLGNHHPFIAENGGGIYIPEGYFPFPFECETKSGYRVISLGLSYGDIRKRFIFAGATDDRFLQAIEADGLRWTHGRIFHIMGKHHKGKAVSILRGLY